MPKGSDAKRPVLVYSPSAGKDGFDFSACLERLRRRGIDAQALSTKEDGLAEQLAEIGPDLILAAGGDGTVEFVLRCAPRPRAPVWIVPEGSANNLARSFGIEGEADELLDRYAEGEVRLFPLGLASWDGQERTLTEAAGAGGIAACMERCKGENLEDKVKAAREALAAGLPTLPPMRAEVVADGRNLGSDLLFAEVLLLPVMGPQLKLAPDHDPSDKAFTIAYTRAGRAQDLADWIAGGCVSEAPVERVRANGAEIRSFGDTLRLEDRFHTGTLTVAIRRSGEAVPIAVPRTHRDG